MIGRVIAGRYKITEPLGNGGMGETFLEMDTAVLYGDFCGYPSIVAGDRKAPQGAARPRP